MSVMQRQVRLPPQGHIIRPAETLQCLNRRLAGRSAFDPANVRLPALTAVMAVSAGMPPG